MTPSALSLMCVSRDTRSREDDNFMRLIEQASCKRHPAHYARGKNKSHPSLILLMKLSEARQLSAARPVLHVCPLWCLFRQGLERGTSSVHVSPKSGSAEHAIYVLPARGHRLTVSVHHTIYGDGPIHLTVQTSHRAPKGDLCEKSPLAHACHEALGTQTTSAALLVLKVFPLFADFAAKAWETSIHVSPSARPLSLIIRLTCRGA